MSVFRPWRRDVRRDIDEALRFHFEARIAELVAQGMRPEAARAKAIEEFGDVDEVRASLKAIDERVAAQQKRADFLESLWYDARHAARSLWRTPAVSITIILTLALGLGVNTAMFSLLDAILFRPPTGVAEPDGVKRMWSTVKFRSGTQYWSGYSFIEYETVEKVLAGKAEFAIYESPSALPLGRGEEPPEVVAVSPASASFFRLLDVRAAMGRIYSPDEDVLLASENVTVISDRFWAREFNRDPDVVGKLVYFADKPYTVIGVMPAGFSGVELNETEVWVPLGANPSFGPRTRASWTSNPNINGFQVLLAIREGTVPQIEQQLTVALRQPGPGYMSDSTTVARLGSLIKAQGPGRTNTAQQVAERASIVSVLVLIIAFANVVNLLLARAVRRRREIAVRLALGSSAARLLRLLVSESVQLAALAAVAAMAAAYWGGTLLRTLLMPEIKWAEDPLHWRVLVVGAVLALAAGVLAGLIPALQSRSPDFSRSLKTGTREGGAGRSMLRNVLVATQAALTVVLLVGAGLFVQSLHNVKTRDIGLTVDRLAFANVSQGNDQARRVEISGRLLAMRERFAQLPGVERVAYTSMRPKWGIQFESVRPEGAITTGAQGSFFSAVSPGFFDAVGTRILRGRDFVETSGRGAQEVLINKAMADSLWPNEDPLEKCVRFDDATAPCYRIVGITQNTLAIGLFDEPGMHVYAPLNNPPSAGHLVGDVIFRVEPERLKATLAMAVEMLKSEFPASKVSTATMAAQMEPEYRPWQLGAILFSLFGVLATLVAAIGVYSSVSYAVSQRTHEFGVRVALGATWDRILRDVLGSGLRVVVVGTVIGIVLAAASGRLIASLIYDVSPTDPVAISMAAGVLIVIAAVACLSPAWRAGRSDPVSALRAD